MIKLKKGLVILGAVGISSVVMVTSGFAAMSGNSGYSVYKEALKATSSLDSVALSGGISLKEMEFHLSAQQEMSKLI